MSTIELKQKIIEQLSFIDDISFHRDIKAIIESKTKDDTYKLSNYQKERIRAGREELSKRCTISHDSLQKEIDQWLDSNSDIEL